MRLVLPTTYGAATTCTRLLHVIVTTASQGGHRNPYFTDEEIDSEMSPGLLAVTELVEGRIRILSNLDCSVFKAHSPSVTPCPILHLLELLYLWDGWGTILGAFLECKRVTQEAAGWLVVFRHPLLLSSVLWFLLFPSCIKTKFFFFTCRILPII